MKKSQPLPISQAENIHVSGDKDFLLSLVIPCYNESRRIDLMLAGLAEFEENWKGSYEVIIVDDGSTDATSEKIKEAIDSKYDFLRDKVTIEKMPANSGKGSALKKGVSLAKGDYLLTLDADMSTKPIELINWQNREKNLFSGSDTIYIGSRRHEEGTIEALPARKFIGGIFNSIVQLFTTLELKDTQCGFKLYPRKAAMLLFGNMQSKGWSHDVELLYQADLNGIGIVEMPISWINQPESKVNVVKDSFMMFIGVLSIALKIWFYNTFILPFRIPDTATAQQRKQILYRSVFNVFAVLLLLVMPIMSFQFAVTGDEHWHYDYGNSIFNYFFHGDKSAQTTDSGIQYYGGIFDFITAYVYNVFHLWDHYTTMHFINAIVGAIGIIYAGKLAKLLGGWNTGILAMVFLVLSPSWFGHNFANPKDIPFSVGYTAGIYYMLLFLRSLPAPSFKYLFGLVCSIGWAMGVRIGGLLLIVYLIFFICCYALFTRQIKTIITPRLVGQIFIVGILGYVIALVCWPYAHLGIITKPLEALKVMENFFISIGMLYDGKKIMSDEVPWFYIPKYILYTAPIIILIGFAIGCIALPIVYRKNKKLLLFSLFLLFTCVFPVLYAIYKKSSLYDGWRHFLFIYPPLVIIASIGWTALINRRQKIIRYATVALITIGLFSPAQYAIAYHPFEALYYNEIAGGLKGIYGKYETDYYMMGIKPACEWLVKNEHIDSKKVIVATTCIYPVQAYLGKYKNITSTYVRFYDRYKSDWDYCIVFSRFVDGSQLQSGNWPSADAIYTVKVQGVPIAAVLKRKTKKDFLGFELLKAKKIDEAKAMFLESLEEFPTNDIVWEELTEIYDAEDNMDSAIYTGTQALKTYPGNINVYQIIGDDYIRKHQPSMALKLYKNLEQYNPSYSHLFTGYVYGAVGDTQNAYNEIDAAIEADPQNLQAYKLGMQIAGDAKDDARLEEYYDKVKAAFSLSDSDIDGSGSDSTSSGTIDTTSIITNSDSGQ